MPVVLPDVFGLLRLLLHPLQDETTRCQVCGRKLRFRWAATKRCAKHREVA